MQSPIYNLVFSLRPSLFFYKSASEWFTLLYDLTSIHFFCGRCSLHHAYFGHVSRVSYCGRVSGFDTP